MLEWYQYILAGLAAVGAGLVNALAGGGTLITFPTLIAMGVAPVVSNMTNTVALLPGYIGGIIGQKKELQGQGHRLRLFMPASAIGGLVGALLLRFSSEKLFAQLVPVLILAASGLLALQEPVKAWMTRRAAQTGRKHTSETRAILPVILAAVYGGYFGAGLSVIILAVLGLVAEDNLTRLNASKQAISLSANTAAAVFFAFSGLVDWGLALVLSAGSLVGGVLGGRLAGRIRPATLRWLVVSIGTAVGIVYLVR